MSRWTEAIVSHVILLFLLGVAVAMRWQLEIKHNYLAYIKSKMKCAKCLRYITCFSWLLVKFRHGHTIDWWVHSAYQKIICIRETYQLSAKQMGVPFCIKWKNILNQFVCLLSVNLIKEKAYTVMKIAGHLDVLYLDQSNALYFICDYCSHNLLVL